MKLAPLVGAALLLTPAVAGAEGRQIMPVGSAKYFDILATNPNQDELQFGRQLLPPSAGSPNAIAISRTVYLNRKGVTLAPGNNDSRTNRSTITQQQVAIPAWNTDTATWNATVACIRELFSPFGVTITETDPGSVPHIEAVFGGSPGLLGLPNGVAGVSPFTENCAIIENSIVFTFTNVIPNDARLACEIQAQEIAHSYGLDHELLASDPMTYLDYNANRSFKNQTASCGEDVQRPCGINGSTCRASQNSVALLTERLGPAGQAGDNIAPQLGISSPQDGATVPPGFELRFTATDNVNVTMATLFVDDQQVASLVQAPFVFTTSSTLPEGDHEFRVEVTDGINTKTETINVTIRKGAPPPGGGDNTGTGGGGDLTGGCSTGGTPGGLALLGLGLVGLLVRRRK